MRSTLLLLGLALTLACDPSQPASEDPPASVYAANTGRHPGFVRNPAFVPAERPAIDTRRSALSADGEVLIIEGDAVHVASNGAGSFGILEDNTAAIIQTVLSRYPDQFDTIQIYLSFLDEAHAGSAYYQPIKNEVVGVGADVFDNRAGYGLGPEGRLTGFSNMNDMAMWGDLPQLSTPRGFYYAVIAQELSHRWLMFLKFKDGAGNVSEAFLGRQQAHWSALVHAYGSCQDGVSWIDNGDGTFTHDGESDQGFAPIDLYAMGNVPKEDVPPFFYLVEATLGGMMLGPESHRDLNRGARVNARKIEVGVDDVIAALGPRNPPANTETPYYRAAFVLVTRPGQPRAEWQPYLEALQRVQGTFPETWKEWTRRRGAICTRTSAPCPEPRIGLERSAVADGNDNDLAPGENFTLHLALRNDGLGTAENVNVTAVPVDSQLTVSSGPQVSPPIPERRTADLQSGFAMKVAPEVPCGSVVSLQIKSETQEGPTFTDKLDLTVGTKVLKLDRLDEAPDWRVNPDKTDSATRGQWEFAEPEFIAILGKVTQPPADHTPGEGRFGFFTGPTKGSGFAANDVDEGKTTLESPIFAIEGARDPSLVFYAWHFGVDLTPQTGPVPAAGTDLVVLGSDDGGATYREIGRVSETTTDWQRVQLRLKDQLQITNRMRFRFVIEDPTNRATVEAGLDDLSIIDYLASCPLPSDTPDAGVADAASMVVPGGRDEGCGCRTSGAGAGSLGWVALLLGCLLVRARR